MSDAEEEGKERKEEAAAATAAAGGGASSIDALMSLLPQHLKLKMLTQLNVSAVADENRLDPIHIALDEPATLWKEEELAALNDDAVGYFVRDNFMSTVAVSSSSESISASEMSNLIRAELDQLRQGSLFKPASMLKEQVAAEEANGDADSVNEEVPAPTQQWKDEKSRGDEILWIGSKEKRSAVLGSAVPKLTALLEHLDKMRNELTKLSASSSAPPLFDRSSTQLACYPGNGAGYVRHLDAARGLSSRRLTCLYYANPGWEPQHGGALRIYLNRDAKSGGEATIDIEPRGDRLLVFQSRLLEHEVLPSQAMRYSVTSWFY